MTLAKQCGIGNMNRSATQLRRDALQIWQAGVEAVPLRQARAAVVPCRRPNAPRSATSRGGRA